MESATPHPPTRRSVWRWLAATKYVGLWGQISSSVFIAVLFLCFTESHVYEWVPGFPLPEARVAKPRAQHQQGPVKVSRTPNLGQGHDEYKHGLTVPKTHIHAPFVQLARS